MITPTEPDAASNPPRQKPPGAGRAMAKGRELLARVVAHLQGNRDNAERAALLTGPHETADLRRLHEATLRVARTRDASAMKLEILASTLAAMAAPKGLLWLAVGTTGDMRVAASAGFSAEFDRLLARASSRAGAWGESHRQRQSVEVADAAADELFKDNDLAALVRAGGFRAVRCAPISDGAGGVAGVLSVCFAEPRGASERERALLEAYAEMAAGYLAGAREADALRASEERFRALAEHSPMIVWVMERDGTCSYLNARWSEFTGQPVAKSVGKAWLEQVHPDHRARLTETFAAAAERRAPLQLEYPLRRKDGVYRWMLDAVVPRFDAMGEFLGYTGSVMDITERREAEEAARESAQRLSLAMAVANLGDWTWEAATDRVTFSDRIAALIGVPTSSTLRSEEASHLLHAEDREPIAQSVGRAIATRSDFDVECRVRTPNDEWSWVAMRGRASYGPTGALLGLRGVVQDISARKRAEQKLRAQEAQLRLVGTNAPVILSHWTREHRLLFASRAFADRWHAAPEELVGKTVAEVLGEEAWRAVKPYVDRVLRGESVTFEKEIPYEGVGLRFMRVAYTPEIGDDGAVRGYFASVNDMTDRRRAELALRESEERLRLATQTGKVGLWDWDVPANRITWTESLYQIHGVRPDTFQATVEGFAALVHPDDAAMVAKKIQESLETGERYETEFRAVRPDGEVIWIYTSAVVLRDGGKPIRMLGGTLDVTARKRAELALRASEEKFRALARHAPVGIFMTNRRGDCVFVNEAWCGITGFGPEQAAGEGWMQALHPDDRTRVVTEWAASIKEGRPFALEYRFLLRDGRVAWVQGGAVQYHNSQGEPDGHIGTVADITERKAAEFALRESEKRFRTLANRAPVGIFMTNPQGDTVFVNDTWCAMSGLTAEQALGQGWLQAVHPEDRGRVLSGWGEAVRGGASSTAEYRFLRADGSIAWVKGDAVQLRDANGRLGGYVGTIADFTERKAAEVALRENEERYRRNAERLELAVSAAHLGDWVWDPLTDAIILSPRAAEIYGVTEPGETTRSALRERLHPDDRDRAKQANENAIATRSEYDIEYRLQRPSGEWRWIAAKGRGVYSADGKLLNMLGVVQDITARKAAEEKLRAHEAQLRLVSMNAPTMLVHCDHEARYLFVNREYADRLGRRPDDVVGRTIAEVLGEAAFGVLAPYVARVLAGESVQFELEVPYRELGKRFMRISYVPDVAADGRVRGWLAAISDLSDWRKGEQELRTSEARYRQLVKMLPVAVYTCDREGRVELYNDAAVEMWGRTPVPGADRWSGAHKIYYPDGTPVVLAQGAMAAAVREGTSSSRLEVIIEQPGGARRNVLAYPHPLRNGGGEIVGAVNALVDITEHRLAEKNAAFLNGLSQELAALADADEIMRHATRAVGEWFGVDRCYFFEAVGDRTHVRVGLDWHKGETPSVQGIYRVDSLGRSKWWAAFEGGVLAIEDTSAHPLTGELNASYAALGIRGYVTVPVLREGRWAAALAVTTQEARGWREDELTLLGNVATLVWPMVERARAEAALQAHAQELEHKVAQRTASLREAIAQMEEFSYSVSHDLRSPLRAMNAYAEALLEDYGATLDETARTYLERIHRSSIRMEKLTHDVLTYSRIARDEQRLAPVALERLVRDLIDQYAELQPAAADVTIDAPHRVLAHEPSLGQCLGNLLTNAAKFVRPGERPKIMVRSEEVDDRVRISVRDEGIGIPPQYHGALFQVFERVPTRARYEGTGIGLAIVRKAAEKMGGRCGMDSDGENGSTFWVELSKA